MMNDGIAVRMNNDNDLDGNQCNKMQKYMICHTVCTTRCDCGQALPSPPIFSSWLVVQSRIRLILTQK